MTIKEEKRFKHMRNGKAKLKLLAVLLLQPRRIYLLLIPLELQNPVLKSKRMSTSLMNTQGVIILLQL